MTFPQSFDSPIVFTSPDLTLTLPRLTIRDYAAWTAELHAARKIAAIRLLPVGLTPLDRFKALRLADFDEPTLDDIASLLLTPAGAAKALRISLIKSGKSDVESDRIIEMLPPPTVLSLAMEVSSLYEKKPAADDPTSPFPPSPAPAT